MSFQNKTRLKERKKERIRTKVGHSFPAIVLGAPADEQTTRNGFIFHPIGPE